MCRKLICLISCVLVIGVVLTSAANAADANLVGWWTLDDEGTGTVLDYSGNSREGSLSGNPLFVPGIYKEALEFHGGPDGVLIDGYKGILGPSAFSITAWIQTSEDGEIVGWGGNAAGRYKVEFRINSGRLRCEHGHGNIQGDTGVTDGEWHHVAVTVIENATISYPEVIFYLDGQDDSRHTIKDSPFDIIPNMDVSIGWRATNLDRYFIGCMDDVRIYDRTLLPEEIKDMAVPPMAIASKPSPADGAIHPDNWVSLSWSPGTGAVSHDVYFNDNFDDVNGGTPETFQGNQVETLFVVGTPGHPYPDGLVPGLIYYWRVDEIEADGAVNKGDVWSFTVQPVNAFDPYPANGANFIDPNTKLSWKAGLGTGSHTVYFGDNFEDVSNAAGGLSQTDTIYDPGALEFATTYYWRVDEFDGVNTYKGDVWSFTTVSANRGLRGDYYTGMNFEKYVLTRIDPQINFQWGQNGPDEAVGSDNFSIRWIGEVEVLFTEPYTFYTRTNDGARLWVDGQQLVDDWTIHGATENNGTIDLVAGRTYSMVMEYFENIEGAIAELRWSSPSTPKDIIPEAALSLPVKARHPNPSNGAADVKQAVVLRWSAGQAAASHQVYFGTDEEAVRNAHTGSPEYKDTKPLGSESYDPGKLQWNTPYYWRVDEVNDVNPDSPWVGNVWSFTTADFLPVEDFESYNDLDPDNPESNRIFNTWIDGWGVPTNGSTVGYAEPEFTAGEHFVETEIVHGGSQSMPYFYENDLKYSEATMPLSFPRDWTEQGVGVLSLWFRGHPVSVGSFTEAPAGTYTMTASGADIWGTSDEFHFAYKQLTGPGSIIAKVESVQKTHDRAKAGVMIRNTLDPDSAYAMMVVTPGANGVSFELRTAAGEGTSRLEERTGIKPPQWVKIEHDAGGVARAYYSADGISWTDLGRLLISMDTPVYIGLALTAHNANATCEAVFSNVQFTGTVDPQWTNLDIGILSNDPEPMYMAIANSTGTPATVYHDDPGAAQIGMWTEWRIDLQKFSDQGVDLTNVDQLSIGFGDKNNLQPGGSGVVYFDDLRLYPPAAPEAN